jgi:hypothetical protein
MYSNIIYYLCSRLYQCRQFAYKNAYMIYCEFDYK